MRTISYFDGLSEAGATFLDQRMHRWHRHIKIESLDIGDCRKCILGQLFRRYNTGLEAMNILRVEAIKLGIYAGIRNQRKREQRYIMLTAAWRTRIAERLEEDRKQASLSKPKRVGQALTLTAALAISIFCLIAP